MKTKKLSINKKTVANLNSDAMKIIRGGIDQSYNYSDCVTQCETIVTQNSCSCGTPTYLCAP